MLKKSIGWSYILDEAVHNEDDAPIEFEQATASLWKRTLKGISHISKEGLKKYEKEFEV